MPTSALFTLSVCAVLLFAFIGIGTLPCACAMSTPTTKRILVTGGNKGIGKAICQRLLENYADTHVLLGSRDKARGEAAVRDVCAAVPGSDGRIELVQIDTSDDGSVEAAAENVAKGGGRIYGIVNNAGVGFGAGYKDTLQTNYFGPRRVNDAFSDLLVRPGGRIVNIASASGPMFVQGCQDPELKKKLTEPVGSFPGGIEELDQLAASYLSQTDYGNDAYGVSKALLNAYTALHAEAERDLVINSCSPGFIDTDITRGMGATNPPSMGAVPPSNLLMEEVEGRGWYYGSDTVRSPLHFYRGPGEPAYVPE